MLRLLVGIVEYNNNLVSIIFIIIFFFSFVDVILYRYRTTAGYDNKAEEEMNISFF
jgi:hypothetical protein